MNLGQENENQEFKQSLSQLDKGIKSLTAMLNRNQKGIVYFGVDDNGKVKGLLIGKKNIIRHTQQNKRSGGTTNYCRNRKLQKHRWQTIRKSLCIWNRYTLFL